MLLEESHENDNPVEVSRKRKSISPVRLPHCGSSWKETHVNSIGLLVFYALAPAIPGPGGAGAAAGGTGTYRRPTNNIGNRTASACRASSTSSAVRVDEAAFSYHCRPTSSTSGYPALTLDGRSVPGDFCKLKDFSNVLDYAYIFFKVADMEANDMGMFMTPSLRKLKGVFLSQFLFDITHAGNSAQARTAVEILQRQNEDVNLELEEDEKSILDQVEKSLSDQLHHVTYKRLMLRSASLLAPDSLTTYTCMGGIIKFMDQMKKMLRRCLEMGVGANQRDFLSLFKSFADIFGIHFDDGTSTTSSILGQAVESTPHLLCEKTLEANNRPVICVVTVSEDKKRSCPKKDEEESKPWSCVSSKRRRTDSAEDNDQQSDDDKVEYHENSVFASGIDLPSALKGQHASQLLTKLPYSCLGKNMFDRQRIMGLIIQGTHVRLTCLSLTTEHLHQMMNPPLYDQPHQGQIWFTRGYDMLVPDDRQHLIYIMLGLAYLGDVHRLQLLP